MSRNSPVSETFLVLCQVIPHESLLEYQKRLQQLADESIFILQIYNLTRSTTHSLVSICIYSNVF